MIEGYFPSALDSTPFEGNTLTEDKCPNSPGKTIPALIVGFINRRCVQLLYLKCWITYDLQEDHRSTLHGRRVAVGAKSVLHLLICFYLFISEIMVSPAKPVIIVHPWEDGVRACTSLVVGGNRSIWRKCAQSRGKCTNSTCSRDRIWVSSWRERLLVWGFPALWPRQITVVHFTEGVFCGLWGKGNDYLWLLMKCPGWCLTPAYSHMHNFDEIQV